MGIAGAPSRAEIVSHLRTPLYRNGYALILSSLTTSGLGVVYWILASHFYSTEVVGLNSATISAMVFLTSVAQLNMGSALTRFLPRAGRSTSAYVRYSYLVCVAIAAIVSAAFIFGIRLWSPQLSFLGQNPLVAVLFIGASMAWCVFVLQDSVLTGLQQAVWIPVENAAFAAAKIVLLVAFAAILPQLGIFASWTVPMALALVPVNIFLFRYLMPKHEKATAPKAIPIVPKQIARYVAMDYLGSLFYLASSTLLPIIVTHELGATANAYFYLAWLVANTLQLVTMNMAMSLTVEGAANEEKLGVYTYRVLKHIARLLVPMLIVILIGADLILKAFGNDYAAAGATLLRLVALASVPGTISIVYLGVVRVQRRMGELVMVQAALCVLVLGLSYFLLPVYGITGVGIAWLTAQSIVAAFLVVTRMRRVVRREAPKEPDSDYEAGALETQ